MLKGHSGCVLELSFSPDGRQVIGIIEVATKHHYWIYVNSCRDNKMLSLQECCMRKNPCSVCDLIYTTMNPLGLVTVVPLVRGAMLHIHIQHITFIVCSILKVTLAHYATRNSHRDACLILFICSVPFCSFPSHSAIVTFHCINAQVYSAMYRI